MLRQHRTHRSNHTGRGLLPLGLLAASAVGATLVAWSVSRMAEPRGPFRSDAPLRLRRKGDGSGFREHTVVGRSVTINKPRQELYTFWRDFSNLPAFMENIHRVEQIDERRWRWEIAGPAGMEIEFVSEITDERPNEFIAWQSEEGGDIRNSGRVEFRDAPGGRGTQVTATIAYDAPAGEVGRVIAKLFQREPNIQVRRDLKRFKQLMETGEIADSASRLVESNGR